METVFLGTLYAMVKKTAKVRLSLILNAQLNYSPHTHEIYLINEYLETFSQMDRTRCVKLRNSVQNKLSSAKQVYVKPLPLRFTVIRTLLSQGEVVSNAFPERSCVTE